MTKDEFEQAFDMQDVSFEVGVRRGSCEIGE
jgi:hypothetical protein